jgi:hypothetical protein
MVFSCTPKDLSFGPGLGALTTRFSVEGSSGIVALAAISNGFDILLIQDDIKGVVGTGR